ncbi:MAG: nucleotidyltransferase family protein [Snowella sp.]|nr:nucleotidyltransferase family protein [Snowella sp.]
MIELETIKTLLTKHQTVFKQKYRIKRLGIFGSYVRGEATRDSDLDILVEFQSGYRFGLLTFCKLENDLSDLLGVKVDLVMKDSLKPKIGRQILSEVIYL